jgi:hypothetical protein
MKSLLTKLLIFTIWIQAISVAPMIQSTPLSGSVMASSFPNELSDQKTFSAEFQALVQKITQVGVDIFGKEKEAEKSIFGSLKKTYEEEENKEDETFYISFKDHKPTREFLKKVPALYREVQEFINNENNQLTERQDMAMTSFAMMDLYIQDLLSIWKDDDATEERNKLKQQLKTRIPRDILNEELEIMISSAKFETIDNSDGTISLQQPALELLKRELHAAAQIPGSYHYLKSIRQLTLHMILTQITLYKSFLGKESFVEVPPVCIKKVSDKLPEELEFNMPTNDRRNRIIENLLYNNGLLAGTQAYREYFLDFLNPDLIQGGFSGMIPFESYYNAVKGSENPEYAGIDDFDHFREVLQFKIQEITTILEREHNRHKRRACGGRPCYNKIPKESLKKVEKMLDSIISMSTEDWAMGDGQDTITINTEGLTNFMVHKMQEHRSTDWKELIPSSVKRQLKKNTVSINFPYAYSNNSWFRWALLKLHDKIKSNINNKNVARAVRSACMNSRGSTICYQNKRKLLPSKDIMKKLDHLLGQFQDEGTYIPNFIKNRETITKNIPLLANIWSRLVRARVITDNKVSEWDYIMGQINSYNPWAAIKLSYAWAMGENNSEKESKLLEKLGKVLKLDEVISPNIGNRIIEDEDAQKMFWTNMLYVQNEQNSNLFITKTNKQDKSYYDIIRKINDTNVFKRDNVNSLLRTFDMSVDVDELGSELRDIWNSDHYKKAGFFQQLYQAKGDMETQEQIVDIIMSMEAQEKQEEVAVDLEDEAGFDGWGDYSSEPQTQTLASQDIKILFLDLDNRIKAPLYKYAVQEAAQKRINDLRTRAHNLCDLETDKLDDLKDIFYTTAKAQEDINKELGIKAPESIQVLLERWNKNEKHALWYGLGSAALFIGSAIVGAGCSVLTGGLCMPMTAAVLASLATGTQLYVAKTEFDNSFESGERADEIRKFAELGLTKNENADEVKRSYAWAALEVAFTFPLIGHLGRGTHIAYKVAKNGKALKGQSKAAKKLFYHSVSKEVHADYAKYILGLESLPKKIREAVGRVMNRSVKARNLFTFSSIGKELNKKIIVKQSVEEVDRAFAETVVSFFKNDKNYFVKFMDNYSDVRVQKAKRKLAKYDIYNHPENLSKLRQVWGKTWPAFRMNQLKSFLDTEKDMVSLVAQMKKLPNDPRVLEDFIASKAQTFSLIFSNLLFRKREIPHFMIALGGPAVRSRIPFYSRITEVTILKRIASAREALVQESIRESSRRGLGMKEGVAFHNSHELYSAFRYSIMNLMSQSSVSQSKALGKKLEKLERKLLTNIHEYLTTSGTLGMNESTLKKVLFNPTTDKELLDGERVWNSIPSDKLFDLKDDQEFIANAVKRMADFKGINGFQDYVNALKILSVTKNPELVNLI